MEIDHTNGTIRLSNGMVIDSRLTLDAFSASPFYGGGRQTVGNGGWSGYQLGGGTIDGRQIYVGLSFYDQMLVSVSLTADLYPPGPKSWDTYSDEIEAATKDFHERLVNHLFSKGEKAETFHATELSHDLASLSRPVRWNYPWGQVSSTHDSEGCGTFLTVSYGNRQAQALEAYQQCAAQRAAMRSEIVQEVAKEPSFAAGFAEAKRELARGDKTAAIRQVIKTCGMNTEEAKDLVALWEKTS